MRLAYSRGLQSQALMNKDVKLRAIENEEKFLTS
jgi:hypothetical protein